MEHAIVFFILVTLIALFWVMILLYCVHNNVWALNAVVLTVIITVIFWGTYLAIVL